MIILSMHNECWDGCPLSCLELCQQKEKLFCQLFLSECSLCLGLLGGGKLASYSQPVRK